MDFDFDTVFEGKHDMMPRKTHHVARGGKLGMKSADDILDQTTDSEETYEVTDPNSFEMLSSGKRKDVEEHSDLFQYATREMLQTGGDYALAVDNIGNMLQIGSGCCAVEEPMTAEDMGEWFNIANHEFLDRTGNGEKWNTVVNDLARRFAEMFGGSYDAFEFAASAYAHRAREWGLMEAQTMVESFDTTGVFTPSAVSPTCDLKYRGRGFQIDTTADSQFGFFAPTGKTTVTIKSGSRK